MHTVQVALDESLLQATDRAAEQLNMNRSALVRDALRAYLQRLGRQELELRDRKGYEQFPDHEEDLAGWEVAAAWPDE